jgi:hypothetical protein
LNLIINRGRNVDIQSGNNEGAAVSPFSGISGNMEGVQIVGGSKEEGLEDPNSRGAKGSK